jgi:hypothetical protein
MQKYFINIIAVLQFSETSVVDPNDRVQFRNLGPDPTLILNISKRKD